MPSGFDGCGFTAFMVPPWFVLVFMSRTIDTSARSVKEPRHGFTFSTPTRRTGRGRAVYLGADHPQATVSRPGGGPRVRAGRQDRTQPVANRRPCAACSIKNVWRAVLADAERVVLRVALASLVGRLRQLWLVPILAVDVRAHPERSQVDLRPVRERASGRLAGEA